MPYTTIERALGEIGSRTSAIRLRCAVADIKILKDPREREIAAADRAGAFVWLAAALEQYVSAFIDAVIAELNARSVLQRDLRASLFSLLMAPSLDSLQNVRAEGMWTARAVLFESLLDPVVAVFNPATRPVGGGVTIRPEHFDLVWAVFGLPGASYPSPRHKAVLKDLADSRHSVAHGDLDPQVFGRARTSSDVARVAHVVDDFAEHTSLAATRYLDVNLYLR